MSQALSTWDNYRTVFVCPRIYPTICPTIHPVEKTTIKNSQGLPEFASSLPQSPSLEGGPNDYPKRSWNLIHSPPCRTPCRLFIHVVFFGPLGLHLRVRSEVGRSPPSRPMRALRLRWSRAFSLVCEVALNYHVVKGPSNLVSASPLTLLLLHVWCSSFISFSVLKFYPSLDKVSTSTALTYGCH